MLNFYLYGRVNARRDGQSEICIARKREKKNKIEKNRSLIIAPRATPRGDPGIFADFSYYLLPKTYYQLPFSQNLLSQGVLSLLPR